MTAPCPVCGGYVEPKTWIGGSRRVYCSDKCKRRAGESYRRLRESLRLQGEEPPDMRANAPRIQRGLCPLRMGCAMGADCMRDEPLPNGRVKCLLR
jgi:hypothetical protein